MHVPSSSSSVLASYPPPQRFDSYTLPSRGWPLQDQHPASTSYMPPNHAGLGATREYRHPTLEDESQYYTTPPHLMQMHASSSSTSQQDRYDSYNRTHPQPPPESIPPNQNSYPMPPQPGSWSSSPVQLPPASALPVPSSIRTSPRETFRAISTAESQRAPNAALLYAQSQALPSSSSLALLSTQQVRSASGNASPTYASSSVPRLPPILQVEKQQVTTSATQAASASRRRNEANFICPVPGCGSTFTRRFNLRGHLRSHTEERPFVS
ncbi:hypothetical protein EIP91_007333 [Steccherinum ochraceum]|uniref:C2H2-type domain-containing protein n=1 Tax=Steccherinum ochraceum TaxID=92696 RepID=A0A4R0RUA3_9APHY|nr:hypothetical protein EIP91_007333 [Steccherinum ochraceum]